MGDCDTVDDPAHAWNRWLNVWHGIFAVVVVLLVLWLAVWSPGDRVLGLVAVGGLGLAYGILRPVPDFEGSWRNRTYLLAAIVGTGVAVFADPTCFALLFIVNAQMWIFSSGARRGIGLVAALAVSASLGFVAGEGWTASALLGVAPSMTISVAFSILLGVWINRIIDQSMSRAALISSLESARAELDAAQHAAGVMAERERMAREIHDTLAQGYTSVIMLAQGAALDPSSSAAKLEAIEAVARENLAEARALVAALTPVGLSDSTLVDAIRRLAARFGSETGVAVSLDLPPSLAGLPRDREVVLLRAVQEALTNVRRHACASSVTVSISAGSDVSVLVQDDGIGFSRDAVSGYGLSGMRSRVTEAGGTMDVDSSAEGTTVRVQVPGVVA